MAISSLSWLDFVLFVVVVVVFSVIVVSSFTLVVLRFSDTPFRCTFIVSVLFCVAVLDWRPSKTIFFARSCSGITQILNGEFGICLSPYLIASLYSPGLSTR